MITYLGEDNMMVIVCYLLFSMLDIQEGKGRNVWALK